MRRGERGQALLLALAGLLALALAALVIGLLAAAVGARGARQRAVDLAALAGARALVDLRPAVLERGPAAISPAAYLSRVRSLALRVAAANGAPAAQVALSGGALPTRVHVSWHGAIKVSGFSVGADAEAQAEASAGATESIGDGAYGGPFAHRQGRPMRPDTALAFDRMAVAAGRVGLVLQIASAFRSDAEQARLFAANPDPRWVAPPGSSLHRLGTELDLGPPAAYGWLQRNASRFGFVRRYSWEPWHFGLAHNAGSASVGFAGAGSGALPAWVPADVAPALRRAAQRWSVGAVLLAAQLRQESGFDEHARSSAGALGIAQFIPATARAYGLSDPFDAAASIDAQAHLMHDLLRRFASVPLALAAYNAGPGRVLGCWCVPAIAETQNYVRAIVALARGQGAQDEQLVRLIA